MPLLPSPRHKRAGALLPGLAVPTAGSGETAAAVRERLRRQPHADWDLMCVLDAAGRLVGTLTPAALLALPDDTPVAAAAAPVQARVHPGTSQEEMASVAIENNASAVAVVEDDGRLVGVVGARALMEILRREHVEDLHRLAGISRETERARAALEDAPLRRVRHRLPWLVVGLAGSIGAAAILSGYERELAARPAIAFFLPGLIYLADAIGTQSEAIAVRGLSLSRSSAWRLVLGELRTGWLIGLLLALAAFGLVWWQFADLRLATAVGLAMVSAGCAASVLGFSLPWLLGRLGTDPAYGSGPLATIVQDVLTLAIYLGFVSWLLVA